MASTNHYRDADNGNLDLEARMRGMILSNSHTQGSTDIRPFAPASQFLGSPTRDEYQRQNAAHSGPRPLGSINANGGKYHASHQQIVQPLQTQDPMPRYQASQEPRYNDRNRTISSPRIEQHSNHRMSGNNHQSPRTRYPSSHGHVEKANMPHHHRGPVHQRSLYNPSIDAVQPLPNKNAPRQQWTRAPIQQQNSYVEYWAVQAVHASEMSSDELARKHELRLALQDLCRQAVYQHESQLQPLFDSMSVELVSFGSLATTFGTKGSDMDLVLRSPLSAQDPSSPGSALPRVIEAALLHAGHGARLLSRTRIPIIKFCEFPGPDLLHRLKETRQKWEEKEADRLAQPEVIEEEEEEENAVQAEAIAAAVLDDEETREEEVSNALDSTLDGDDPAATSPPDADTNTKQSKDKAKPRTVRLEAEDPTLDEKPDEERIRLYRLAMKEEWFDEEERSIIYNYISAVENHAPGNVIMQARQKLKQLPLVLGRYRPPPERHLDFPKTGVGIHCDINFSNLLALHNSALLRCYSLCDPRVRPMVLFIKAWAKQRKINSSYESTMSSYGYVLMVLHYLVNIAYPPVLPNLQHFPLIGEDTVSASVIEQDGFDVRFFRNEQVLQDLARQGRLTSNRAPLGHLIREFFQYYGNNGPRNFHWTRDCLSLRTLNGGIVSKQSKGWIAAKTEVMEAGPGHGHGKKGTKDVRQRYLVAIEDPFEIDHNVGRTVSHDGIVAIRDEFRRAHALVQCADLSINAKEGLMDDLPERGNLQFRYFGPRPRRLLPKANEGQKDGEESSIAPTATKLGPSSDTGETSSRSRPNLVPAQSKSPAIHDPNSTSPQHTQSASRSNPAPGHSASSAKKVASPNTSPRNPRTKSKGKADGPAAAGNSDSKTPDSSTKTRRRRSRAVKNATKGGEHGDG